VLSAWAGTGVAAGGRGCTRRCIEDLGDIDVLFTDKTGTLTEGSLRFMRSTGPDGTADDEPLLPALFRGITEIVLSFELKSAPHRWRLAVRLPHQLGAGRPSLA
jgi:P-type E1-E2 ATPase